MIRINPPSIKFKNHFEALVCWHTTFVNVASKVNQSSSHTIDTFCLMALWHTAFMNLLVDFNILERAIGRDSRSNTLLDSDLAYTSQWANSSAARRCILHAYALRDSLSNIRIDTEPAIHVPHCLFLAGIASYL
jgi:hypothetical protein